MKLYDLANEVTIQGNVRVSTWEGDEENVLLMTDNTEDFDISEIEEYEDCEVLYIFCPGDDYLHIEIENLE